MAFSKKQWEYFQNANHRWNFKTGATRSGKTYMDYFVIPKRIRARIGKPGLAVILGVTRSTIERNILEPMRQIWGTELVGEINSQNICYLFGERVYCLGAEKISQVSKLRGASIKYVYGDEVADWNAEVFEMLKSRLDKPYSCFDGALNPKSPNHWLKEFLDSDEFDIYVQKYTIFDNPFLDRAFVENLQKEYKGTVFYQRYILGEWALAEGLLYPQFADDEKRYMIPRSAVPKLSYIEIGADVGGNKSNHAYVATGYTAARDVMYVLKAWSYKATGVTVTQYRENLIKFADSIKEQYGFVDTIWPDCAEAAIVNELDAHSPYHIRGSIKGEILDRVRCADILFSQDRIKIVEGQCEDLCNGLRSAVWDDKHEDQPLDDGTYDRDIIDAFDYSMTPHITQLVRG